MGSGKKVTVGYKIYLGLQQILCRGPIDAIHRIRVDDAAIYESYDGAADEQLSIDKEDLFGGKKQEGGVVGDVDIEFGGPTQEPNDYLQGLLGDDIPAFRGVVSAICRQMYLGTQPYLKKWDFRAKRIHTRQDGQTQWYDAKAAIGGIRQAKHSPFGYRAWGGTSLYIGAAQEISGPYQFLQSTWDGFIDSMRVTKNVCRYNSLTIDPITAAYTLAGDEHADNVVLINNFEGADGSTPSTDDTGNTTNWNWTATVSTDEFKFGTSSGEFNGQSQSNDYLETICDPELGEQFTVECWGYLRSKNSNTYGRPLLSCGPLSTVANDNIFTVNGDNLRHSQDAAADGEDVSIIGYLNNVSLDEWHHFALSRDEAGYYRLYVDFEMVVGFVSDMNPAHIIRECLTDSDWGMGYPEDEIGDSFTSAADTLYREAFGLSLQWDRQRPINEFISDVLEHIDAALYVSKTTGKFELKLIRDDWADSEMITLDEDNVEAVDDVSRSAFGELVNSVSVIFYNADLSKEDAVQVQDIALVQQQGSIIETTVNYPGIRNLTLAARAAERELKAMSTPLVSCTVMSDRTASGLNVGDAFVLDWPDYSIDNLVMRVTEIGYGDGRTNTIKIKCVQDVFDTQTASIVSEAAPETPGLALAPVSATPRNAFETPYYMLVQAVGEAEANNILSANASAGYLTAYGGRANGGQVNAQLWTDSGTGYAEQQTLDFCPIAKPYIDSSGYEIDEGAAVISVEEVADINLVEPPTFALWGDEIIRVDSLTDGSDGIWEMVIGRGCLDTVPQRHDQDSGGQFIFFLEDLNGFDTNEYNDSESVSASILSTTLNETLSLDVAPSDSVTFDSRAIRPYPPGNFRINSQTFPDEAAGLLTVSWSHRDRLQQTGETLEDHLDGDIGPEAGTTYNVRFYDATEALLHSVTGVTDTEYTWATEGTDTGDIDSGYNATYDDEVLLDDTVDVFYTMDEDSAGTVIDATGNGNDGVYGSGVTIGNEGAYSSGTSINGTATVASEALIEGPYMSGWYANLTAGVWFKGTVKPGSSTQIMGHSPYSGYSTWQIGVNSSGQATAYINGHSLGSNSATITGTTDIFDGDWHLLTCNWNRFNGNDGIYRFYVDGVMEASTTWLNTLWYSASQFFMVYRNGSDDWSFDGAFCSQSSKFNDSKMLDLWESRNVADSEVPWVLNAQVRIELESERDGYTSLQMYNHTITRP